jgi:hypothetical protein
MSLSPTPHSDDDADLERTRRVLSAALASLDRPALDDERRD